MKGQGWNRVYLLGIQGENIAEIIGRQVERHDAQWALRERVKELTCLYSIANVASRPGIGQEDFLGEVVNLLPSGWQYPEITQAKITLDNESFMTPGHSDTPYRQSAEIIINDRARGMVEINYAKPMPPAAEGPFLNEERNLINEIARQVGLIIEHWETEKEAVLLQEQLRHAERLATVGQLSAGVAHELRDDEGVGRIFVGGAGGKRHGRAHSGAVNKFAESIEGPGGFELRTVFGKIMVERNPRVEILGAFQHASLAKRPRGGDDGFRGGRERGRHRRSPKLLDDFSGGARGEKHQCAAAANVFDDDALSFF